MGGVWSTQAEMHFLSWFSCDGFVNTSYDAFCFLAVTGRVWSTLFEMYFEFSLAWEGFGQRKLWYILCPRCHESGLVNTSWDTFCVLAGIGWVWSSQVEMHFAFTFLLDGFGQHKLRYILCPRWHGMCLVNTCEEAFCVLAAMVGVCSRHVEINLCPRWHRMRFIKIYWDSFRVLAGMEGEWQTLIEMHFMSLLPWDLSGQHILRYILCSCWHRMGFVKTC